MTATPDDLEETVRRLVAETLAATPGEMVGVVEAARLRGVHRTTITRWAANNKIPNTAVDDLGRTLIPRTWATNHTTKDSQPCT